VQFESKRRFGDEADYNVSKEKWPISCEQEVRRQSARHRKWLGSTSHLRDFGRNWHSFNCDTESRGGVAKLESRRIVTTNLKSMPWYWHPRQLGDATLGPARIALSVG
jgi:hypothetical protein